MRWIVLIGPLAVLLFLVAACGEVDSTSTPSASQESTGTGTPAPKDDGPDVARSPSPDIELAAEGTWVLELLDGRPVIEDSAITLMIGDDWFDGINGCNSYRGQSRDGTPVVGADGVFKIPPGATVTEMLCLEPEGVMDQADAYMSAFMQGKRYRVPGERLEILDGEDEVRLVFIRQAPLLGSPIDLEGTAWWLLQEADTDGDVRAPTMVFLR